MPVTEAEDYILLINQQIEAEHGEVLEQQNSSKKQETPTIRDVFKGSFTPSVH